MATDSASSTPREKPSGPDAFRIIAAAKVIPVATMDEPSKAVSLARSLEKGGIPVVEFTFRTSGAEASIAAVAKNLPGVLVGAGTVLTVGQARAAVRAGAGFVVSPGLDPAVVRYCQARKVAVIPGACTPTEIQDAIRLGLDVLKFFPSEALGGLKTLKAMAAPFPGIRFIPTGGIGLKNLREYLAWPGVVACGGTWLADGEAVSASDWAAVTRTAAETARLCAGAGRK
jgi:2-dehydro-3-deoxyphosphogluconate aldolase/(4S)-4-hydroxy-2-oxoglutarate aldolase